MDSKVFLDANFLLDFLLKRKGYDIAFQLLSLAQKRKIKAFTNPSIIQTISFYLQKNFDPTISKVLLLELLKILTIVETDQETILNALNSPIKDIEDAIHYYTVLKHQLDYLITNDIDFLKLDSSLISIKTPTDFLKLFQD
ncbi:PilT protein domain protein [Pseudopedobacter saltans DSM 12145]|uniref:PilT protein domain protein n=1 Tax=Pseudopedobacter saltans (strain ATCC 51119 / DSM 12145 / JCM 21818 / CCUG 39354 / LMG 10337 / NBRC 100064 / NCIMB 13643) TaxID=762903 RepID=F0S8B4_PSESL|nr:putative toxin-antitoxin system toxin component, PIN family [Pseudopedobacter saltans]ADY53378.1 PilT protein domain protein [Pseudopedobacter saltans DSM 12145]